MLSFKNFKLKSISNTNSITGGYIYDTLKNTVTAHQGWFTVYTTETCDTDKGDSAND